jgi:hypothetical protein
MNSNSYDLISESRKVYARSILCEQVSRYVTETLIHIESNLGRELDQDEIENILIHLTDENNI